MSQYLNYLEKYEEKGNDVIIYLKEFPSSKIAGNKIVRELYIYFFHDEALQLNQVKKINALTYLIQKKHYLCLNCKNPIFFEEDSNYITTCEKCNWRNELNDTPAIKPITILSIPHGKGYQICYPLLEEKDLEDLPEKLKEAILIFFKTPEKFEKKHKENIYHNLFKKDPLKFDKISRKFKNKAKLARFFRATNFINKEFDCEGKEDCDTFLSGECEFSEECKEYKKKGDR